MLVQTWIHGSISAPQRATLQHCSIAAAHHRPPTDAHQPSHSHTITSLQLQIIASSSQQRRKLRGRGAQTELLLKQVARHPRQHVSKNPSLDETLAATRPNPTSAHDIASDQTGGGVLPRCTADTPAPRPIGRLPRPATIGLYEHAYTPLFRSRTVQSTFKASTDAVASSSTSGYTETANFRPPSNKWFPASSRAWIVNRHSISTPPRTTPRPAASHSSATASPGTGIRALQQTVLQMPGFCAYLARRRRRTGSCRCASRPLSQPTGAPHRFPAADNTSRGRSLRLDLLCPDLSGAYCVAR
eukprot:239293-Rhodomonas_salina.1